MEIVAMTLQQLTWRCVCAGDMLRSSEECTGWRFLCEFGELPMLEGGKMGLGHCLVIYCSRPGSMKPRSSHEIRAPSIHQFTHLSYVFHSTQRRAEKLQVIFS